MVSIDHPTDPVIVAARRTAASEVNQHVGCATSGAKRRAGVAPAQVQLPPSIDGFA